MITENIANDKPFPPQVWTREEADEVYGSNLAGKAWVSWTSGARKLQPKLIHEQTGIRIRGYGVPASFVSKFVSYTTRQ